MASCQQCGKNCGLKYHMCATCGHLMCINCATRHYRCPKCGGRVVEPRPGYEDEAIEEAKEEGII